MAMKMNVTVGSLEELNEMVDKLRTHQGVAVAVYGVRIGEARDVLAVLRHQVGTLHWRVEEGTMAALEAAAGACLRLVALGRLVDAAVSAVKEGLPIPPPHLDPILEAACAVSTSAPPILRSFKSLHDQCTTAAVLALDLARQARTFHRVVLGLCWSGAPDRGELMWRLCRRADEAREQIAIVLGTKIPSDDAIQSITDKVSDLALE